MTGATGGIGSALCERLASENWTIVALVRAESDTEHLGAIDGVSFVTSDLLDVPRLTELMRGCEAVFHLAAAVPAAPGTQEHEFRVVNVDGTRGVVSAAANAGVSAFVLFSSVKVYPETDDLLNEWSPVAPSTAYGKSKLDAEAVAFEKSDVIRVTVLRLPVVYGPRDRGNVRRMIEAIARARFVIPGSGENVKTMVGVDNVTAAALLVVDNDRASGRVYIVADDPDASLREIVAAICSRLSRPLPPRVPKRLLLLAGQLADLARRMFGVSLPISADQIRKLSSSARFDGGRIKRELGFKPSVSLSCGIASAVDGYRAERQTSAMPASRVAGAGTRR